MTCMETREWVGNSFVNTLLDDSEQDEFRISREVDT